MPRILRIGSWTFFEGLGRLVDLAPAEIVVPAEENDWGLIGGDLRAAIGQLTAADQAPSTSDDHDDELVEA